MPSLKESTWPSVLEDIRQSVGDQRFSLWFSNVKPIQLIDNQVTLGVPNLFVQEWLNTHFHDVLSQSFHRSMGAAPSIKFRIDPQLFQESRQRGLDADADIVKSTADMASKPVAEATKPDVETPCIRPDFTLNNFVIGSFNKLAHACATELIGSPSNRLSPLFIHGQSGLGKSHLLQAIWHEVNRNGNGSKAVYVTAEAFTNQYIYAVRNRRVDGFRHLYRNAELLMIDDVHFISRKNGLQEELLHTFDVLECQKRQVILASDAHPKMLVQVKQSLVNRLASGMIVKIGRPNYTTRVAILKSKLQTQRRRFPEDVVKYIARGFEGSIRELIGAMTSVVAYSSLTREGVSVPLAQRALSRSDQPVKTGTNLEVIEEIVSRHYGISPATWHGRRLTRAARFPRQVCMYLARQHTDLSCREVAQYFGSANHSTVVFATNRITEEMKKDPHLAELIAAMGEEIRRS